VAAALTRAFLKRSAGASGVWPAVTVIKPLHRQTGGLADSLATFFSHDYPGAVQFLFGVADGADPAAGVVLDLKVRRPDLDIELLVDPRTHGANRKVSNLINLARAARHPVLVLSDADISVAPNYLRRVVVALSQPGVGAVTCFYSGAPDAGVWAALAAMAIDYHFMANAIVGRTLGLAAPCFGSTIAMTRETLARIGGFEAFRDHLADDYEVGRAVRALGMEIAIPPMTVAHHCHESGFGELFRHEIRWARTVRLIDPAGYCGSAVTNPFPLAIAAWALLGFSAAPLALIFIILGVRIAAKFAIDGATGVRAGPWWLLPARDMLSFAVFAASFAGSSVEWQGQRFRVSRNGVLTPL